jgi:hypothetical protein
MSSWWRMGVQRWEMATDVPLWLRAAERIPAAAGGVIPGPLDIAELPAPTSVAPDDLVAGWVAWWTEIVRGGPADAPILPGDFTGMVSADFPALAGWPALQSVARARWDEAMAWHASRKQDLQSRRFGLGEPALPAWGSAHLSETLELWGRRLGRQAHLELAVLPVIDHEIRTATENRYLVSERSYNQPGFAEALTAHIERLWSE